MNIFILSKEPRKAARFHADKHVNKMILESAQMLATAYYHGRDYDGMYYKPTHVNHPCNIWIREARINFIWLQSLMKHLNNEYKYRFDKDRDHASYTKHKDIPVPHYLQMREMTPFKQCMPDEYRDDNPVTAYRNYYNGDKQHLFKWTKREVPFWVD